MKKSIKRRIAFLLIAAIVLVGCSTDILTGGKQAKADTQTIQVQWEDGVLTIQSSGPSVDTDLDLYLDPDDGKVLKVANADEIKEVVLKGYAGVLYINNLPQLESVNIEKICCLGSLTKCPQLRTIEVGTITNAVSKCLLDGSPNVEEIEIGQVNTIEDQAFINCKKLKRVSIQTGTVTIWDEAFSGCSALEKVEIGANVKAIKARAFQGCTSLSTLKLPDTVLEIGQSAFANCPELKQVVMPADLQTIGTGSFTNSDIYWKGEKITFESEEKENKFFSQMQGTMYIPQNSEFWKKIKEKYPSLQWKEWVPEEGTPDKICYLEDAYAWQGGTQNAEAKLVTDEEGVSCFQLLLEERYQRVAFELPDWFNVDDYASLTISAKVGTQLLVDFWGESLEQSLKKGRLVANCPWVIESVYPFANMGTSEIKYATEMKEIPESTENGTETAKYLAFGSCFDPDETRDNFNRDYLFYLYSITFNPVNPEDGKVVFTCRQPEPTPTPTVTPSPTEIPDETPAASPEITPAEPTANTSVDEVRQTPVVTPRAESQRSTPSLTVKKQSKQQILRIVVTDKKAEYFELYVKQKGKRYTKVKLTKKKLKNGKCKIRLSYIKKRQELWFKVRTYTKNKGKKNYRAYSKEKKIRV